MRTLMTWSMKEEKHYKNTRNNLILLKLSVVNILKNMMLSLKLFQWKLKMLWISIPIGVKFWLNLLLWMTLVYFLLKVEYIKKKNWELKNLISWETWWKNLFIRLNRVISVILMDSILFRLWTKTQWTKLLTLLLWIWLSRVNTLTVLLSKKVKVKPFF